MVNSLVSNREDVTAAVALRSNRAESTVQPFSLFHGVRILTVRAGSNPFESVSTATLRFGSTLVHSITLVRNMIAWKYVLIL